MLSMYRPAYIKVPYSAGAAAAYERKGKWIVYSRDVRCKLEPNYADPAARFLPATSLKWR
jgi:hypothetical protein